MATSTKPRKLNGTVFIHPREDDPEGTQTIIYEQDDVPSPEDAERLGSHVWAPEEEEDEDGNAYIRDADVNLQQLLLQAQEFGIAPGKGLPRNPSHEAVARAIRFAQGRATTSETVGSTDAAKDVNVADELDGMSAPGRDYKRTARAAKQDKGTSGNDATGA